jgi:tryptophan-rich sensory protein
MTEKRPINKTAAIKLAVFVIFSELAGVVGSLFTYPAIKGWYSTVIRPQFSPPNWLFGPVWTTLYALMGVAAYLIWRKGSNNKNVKIALGLFTGQLVLNTLWSFIFFGLRSPGMAFIEIIVLWLSIVATIIAFAKISKSAAWLLAPYIGWVSFAAFLNYSIWILNP